MGVAVFKGVSLVWTRLWSCFNTCYRLNRRLCSVKPAEEVRDRGRATVMTSRRRHQCQGGTVCLLSAPVVERCAQSVQSWTMVWKRRRPTTPPKKPSGPQEPKCKSSCHQTASLEGNHDMEVWWTWGSVLTATEKLTCCSLLLVWLGFPPPALYHGNQLVCPHTNPIHPEHTHTHTHVNVKL